MRPSEKPAICGETREDSLERRAPLRRINPDKREMASFKSSPGFGEARRCLAQPFHSNYKSSYS